MGELDARPSFAPAAQNPMLLSKLIEYVQHRRSFPPNVHTILGTWLQDRLQRDSDKISQRLNISPEELGSAADTVASTTEGSFVVSRSRPE